jgi:hypothetical protein
VLDLVGTDRALLAQRRVDVLLLRLGMRHVQGRERPTYGVAIGTRIPQLAEQRLEPAMIIQDQLDHVPGDGVAKLQRRRCHGLTLLPRPSCPGCTGWASSGTSAGRR